MEEKNNKQFIWEPASSLQLLYTERNAALQLTGGDHSHC